MNVKQENDYFEGTLDRWENGRGIIRFGENEQLSVPRRYLPKNLREGSIVALHFMTQEMASTHREEQARLILKELLSG